MTARRPGPTTRAIADSFGLGDGTTDLSGIGATADASVAEARRRQPSHLQVDRWPTSGTILRRIGLVVLAIIAVGLARADARRYAMMSGR